MESIADQSMILTEKKGMPETENHGDNIETCSNQCSENSDNDFKEESSFFSVFAERRPYSYDEDVEILNFVLKDQNIYRVSSVLLWKYLETKKKNPRRTYQSLKNRFLRNIKPKIFVTYRHLIKNEDQIKKILDKFPELKKDAKISEPLSVQFKTRKPCDKITEDKVQNVNLSETSGGIRAQTPLQASTPMFISQAESGMKKVEFCGKSITITIPRNLVSHAPLSNSHAGIYQKYLNCKAKNKLVPCPTCGRGGPDLEPSEVQDSENENDVIIASSIRNKNSKSLQNNINSKTEKRSRKDIAVAVKNVKRPNSTSDNSQNSSKSPSLLEGMKSPDTPQAQKDGRTQSEESRTTKSTSSKASKRKFITSAAQPPGDLTDEELELLYNESVQKCEKLMSSEEEEALVKKCFKKNRRAIGFDSYVLLNKCNLDSFFAKSHSPPLDSLSADPVTSSETTEKSPLVENMKRMLRQKNYKTL